MKQSLRDLSNTIGVVGSIALIILLTLFIQTKSVKTAKQSIGESLNTILETTSQSLIIWSRQERREAISWANTPLVKLNALGLVNEKPLMSSLLKSEHQINLREFLTPVLEANQYKGYFVISKSGVNLASSRNNNIGVSTLISKKFLESVWLGNTVITNPLKSDVILRDENGVPLKNQVSLFVGAPIYDDNKVVAALTFRIDPSVEFYSLLERGRIGKSGETYALSSEGVMVSQSRFEAQLYDLQLLKPKETSATNIKILDPKVNLLENEFPELDKSLDMTEMALSIHNHKSGFNFDGYNDYRGVTVLGAWIWLDELSIGLTTEIDKSEALESAKFSNLFSWFFALIMILLIVGLTLLQRKSHKLINKSKNDLLELNEELEERVVLRTQEAVAAAEAKSEFLANMSHEIRTPLNAITGFKSLLFNTRLSEEQKLYVKNLGRASNSLLSLINDILDFSKIEAGMLTIEKEEFALDDIFENLSAILNVKTEEKHLEFIFEVGDGVPRSVVGDITRLNQILINLCNNAVKFTHRGEVKVKIEVLNANPDGITLGFSVSDTGIGIPQESLKTLFDAFTQADTSTTRKFGGTGLGLTISSKLVALMGGGLKVESQEGVGSIFSFNICFERTLENISWAEINRSLHGKRVLLVDDNPTTQIILSNILTKNNLYVTVASSGEQAIEFVNENLYDFILMDMLMEGMDGIQTSKYIKEQSVDLAPVVIMVTGVSAEKVIKEAKSAGVEGYIQKPINPCQLIHTINGVLCSGNDTAKGMLDVKNQISSEMGQKRLILLVEDNELNQIVATNLLEKAGFKITLAKNGQEAVALAAENEFDIVLMDIQMPIMGGYEATLEIRKTNKDIPIIAMTANAQLRDKEKAFEVGMNDYVGKPLDTNFLFNTIEKWTDSKPVSNIVDTESIEPEVDQTLFDYTECLERFVGEKELLLEAVKRFDESQLEKLEEIKRVFVNGEEKEFKSLIHAFKGSSGNMAMKAVYAIVLQIEKQNELTHSLQGMQELLDKLESTVIQTNQELQRFLSQV